MGLRSAYARARYLERDVRMRLLRRMGWQKGVWSAGLREEYEFWERTLLDSSHSFDPAEMRRRMDPKTPLQDELRQLINAAPGANVRLIDVGAGPLTSVGKLWPERSVQIVPVDPLAKMYNELLAKLKIVPSVATLPIEGERLLKHFPENSFDLATAFNALDHAYDPVAVIRQMVAVVKPGCHVYLWHVANVADYEGHRGLHQWNFDVVDGDMTVRGDRGTRSLSSALAGAGKVRSWHEKESRSGLTVVACSIQKSGNPTDL
jgi:SAM-dependent methyltransferase